MPLRNRDALRYFALVSMVACAASSVMAQPGGLGEPDGNGFYWSTVGAVGNDPVPKLFGNGISAWGRGRVDYQYNISRFEIRTEQWMEFVNTFTTQSDALANFGRPLFWGARVDSTYTGPGRRYRLSSITDAAWLPVTAITWRDAARYSNWLHNNKGSDLSTLITGAYDTTTWTTGPPFGDDPTHLPGARFWIPNVDEWIKAGYYDPDRNGPGQGGWWLQPNGSDVQYHGAPPAAWGGDGETSAFDPDDYNLPAFTEWNIPLGAYPDSQTPWGLFDVSGGTEELLEDWAPGSLAERIYIGSTAGSATSIDELGVSMGGAGPDIGTFSSGLRIVSLVPSPSGVALAIVLGGLCLRRKR